MEPLLEYKRGEGWIYECRKSYPSSLSGMVYIELRKPNPGELCCWVDNRDEHTEEEWADWIKCSRGYRYTTLEHEMLDLPYRYWCTFIPVNGEGDTNGL
jgi:hypothetical protein